MTAAQIINLFIWEFVGKIDFNWSLLFAIEIQIVPICYRNANAIFVHKGWHITPLLLLCIKNENKKLYGFVTLGHLLCFKDNFFPHLVPSRVTNKAMFFKISKYMYHTLQSYGYMYIGRFIYWNPPFFPQKRKHTFLKGHYLWIYLDLYFDANFFFL